MYFKRFVHTFKEDAGAQSIGTIPLDSYTPECSKYVIGICRLWGQRQLLSCIIYSVILVKYLKLLPLGILIFWMEWMVCQLMTKYIVSGYGSYFDGIPTEAIGSFAFPFLGIVLFWLSLPKKKVEK